MTILQRIKPIIYERFVYEGEISTEMRLVEDLDADSLDVVDLVSELEDEFGIEIMDEDLPKITTLGDIVNYIQARI